MTLNVSKHEVKTRLRERQDAVERPLLLENARNKINALVEPEHLVALGGEIPPEPPRITACTFSAVTRQTYRKAKGSGGAVKC